MTLKQTFSKNPTIENKDSSNTALASFSQTDDIDDGNNTTKTEDVFCTEEIKQAFFRASIFCPIFSLGTLITFNYAPYLFSFMASYPTSTRIFWFCVGAHSSTKGLSKIIEKLSTQCFNIQENNFKQIILTTFALHLSTAAVCGLFYSYTVDNWMTAIYNGINPLFIQSMLACNLGTYSIFAADDILVASKMFQQCFNSVKNFENSKDLQRTQPVITTQPQSLSSDNLKHVFVYVLEEFLQQHPNLSKILQSLQNLQETQPVTPNQRRSTSSSDLVPICTSIQNPELSSHKDMEAQLVRMSRF